MSRLLDQVRDRVRALHYSIRTEDASVTWARRFILDDLGAAGGPSAPPRAVGSGGRIGRACSLLSALRLIGSVPAVPMSAQVPRRGAEAQPSHVLWESSDAGGRDGHRRRLLPPGAGGTIRPSPLVQLLLVAGVGLYGASVVRDWIRPSQAPVAAIAPARPLQRTYVIAPGIGTQSELHAMLHEGWRITQVATSSAPIGLEGTFFLAIVMEDPNTKVQEILTIDPRMSGAQSARERIAELASHGSRITQMSCAGSPVGGTLQSHTVFVLEK